MTATELLSALSDENSWWRLVNARRDALAAFLRFARARELGGPSTSLRLEHRGDLERCRSVVTLFDEPWWGVVVYSCFDSTIGTRFVADRFAQPIDVSDARQWLDQVDFPRRSVQHHRAQATVAGARRSLISACEKWAIIRRIVAESEAGFEERFVELMNAGVDWWGRTTCFDVVLRAGHLGVAGITYRPDTAHLSGSTGPAKGFERIWGARVTRRDADLCEDVLRMWTATWSDIATRVGVEWQDHPYDSADLENSLCVFQEP